ncbi:MAG: GIY-YIG nuclease family protein [Desulfuromonadaceae bacterium]|nr:GIY-YIG nuclease family protein [Desulfuromonadaceae bacterium]
MSVNFLSLPELARVRLEDLSHRLQGLAPNTTRAFQIESALLLPNTLPSAFLRDIDSWVKKKRPYLYYLQILDSSSLSHIEKAFTAEKSKSDRAYARFNSQSKVLYVGSSSDIGKRIREHLGYGAKATYALQLAHWCRNLNMSLEFVLADYSTTTGADLLQTLEDTLWDNLHPMFGRKGSR